LITADDGEMTFGNSRCRHITADCSRLHFRCDPLLSDVMRGHSLFGRKGRTEEMGLRPFQSCLARRLIRGKAAQRREQKCCPTGIASRQDRSALKFLRPPFRWDMLLMVDLRLFNGERIGEPMKEK
jgi:hypothetical protein